VALTAVHHVRNVARRRVETGCMHSLSLWRRSDTLPRWAVYCLYPPSMSRSKLPVRCLFVIIAHISLLITLFLNRGP